jgi:hypothetical protein
VTSDALIASLMEIERHVSRIGWDQPVRLFALVPTMELLAAEPALAQHAHRSDDPEALSAVEQDEFRSGGDIQQDLERISWPGSVTGCAIALERAFVPADVESSVPADPDEAARFVAGHPRRQDVRVVVGVLRDGSSHGLARLKSNPEELMGASDLVPGLTLALAQTLED